MVWGVGAGGASRSGRALLLVLMMAAGDCGILRGRRPLAGGCGWFLDDIGVAPMLRE